MHTNRLRGEAHPNAKLKNDQVLEIRYLYKCRYSTKVIARNYKISEWNVNFIVSRKTWNHI